MEELLKSIGQQFAGVSLMSDDPIKAEQYQRAYKAFSRTGCFLSQGGEGSLKLIWWYQNIHKPGSKENRRSIIELAFLTQIHRDQSRKALALFAHGAKGMCKDCAFRKDSDANNDDNAVSKAMTAVLTGRTFYCHTADLEFKNIKCKGFEAAMKYDEVD
ncbi:hypothetical protein [Runella sp.]|uniref:hypothetical protein n=1 Tax=Runella sp. TaxID=1960881 RepID=UPI003D09D2FC